MIGCQLDNEGDTLLVRRIELGRGEEAVPVLRSAVQIVKAMTDVSDDAVDVDDRERPRQVIVGVILTVPEPL